MVADTTVAHTHSIQHIDVTNNKHVAFIKLVVLTKKRNDFVSRRSFVIV